MSSDPAGLTVEKCLDDALDWKHAGVGSNGKCFFANELANPSQHAPTSDCNLPCPGDPKEVCGGVSRVMVYQDTIWDITTISELQAALFSFNSTIVALQAAVVDLQRTAQQSSSSTLSATTSTIANEQGRE
ncbi:uncharacterized protein K444DRAFT_177152 [Hyaloscypha bicolor E]|uniref:WSC domain-containing protein n=1 Tax=Hyaloscypha bicolor E TaxID=1095630 RepID=A0A2J6TQL4_9HELO|nr:uncharacterized protein K444DRAFT_177152 [Hyaloscypha bicolor E]PMD65309.1 hypothetical protein K444DRAFT_177152 [Hyaloscypha bicolor E]